MGNKLPILRLNDYLSVCSVFSVAKSGKLRLASSPELVTEYAEKFFDQTDR